MPRKSLIVLVVLIGSAGLFSGVGADDHTEAHGGDLYDMPTGSAGEKFVITRSEDIDRSLLEFLKDDPIKGEDGLNSFDRMTRSYRISAELRSATHGTCILASFVHAESLKDLTKGVEVLDAVKDSGSFVVALGIGHGVQIWRIGVLEAVLHPHAYLGKLVEQRGRIARHPRPGPSLSEKNQTRSDERRDA